MRFLLFILIASYTLAVCGCAAQHKADAGDAGSAKPRIVVSPQNPWSHLNLRNDPEDFQFAIVTDRTGGHRPGVFMDAVNKLNLLQPEFVMSVGDLIEGYTENQAQIDSEWDEFNGFIDQLEMPFFYLPGNHDISNQVMADDWSRRFGAAYYHFVYRDVLFLCLNSEGPPSSQIDTAQIEYVAKALAANPQVRWTLVFLHEPLWNYNQDTRWDQIETLLAGRPHSVFAGHFHTYTKHVRQGQNYIVLATTGGASSLRGPLFGQFDHVVWVTMTDTGPRLANLQLDGIWDENVRTETTAQMLAPLVTNRAVALSPVFAEEAVVAGGVTELRLTNDADVPLHIKGGFAAHPVLTVEPSIFERLLPPNSVEKLPLEVNGSEALDFNKLNHLKLEWQAEYQQEQHRLPVVDGSSSLAISRLFDLPTNDVVVTVDGVLDDWPTLPHLVEEPAQIYGDAPSWTGAADCSYRFGLSVDAQYLYLAVEVTDESPVYVQKVAWQQDGVEIRLDGRADPMRSNNNGDGDLTMESHLFVALSPDADPAAMTLVERERLAAFGVKAVIVPTDKGHNTEIAIPLSYLEQRQGKDWDRMRLNIAVNDYDDNDTRWAQLWWQPDWRGTDWGGPGAFPGSGTFQRLPRQSEVVH